MGALPQGHLVRSYTPTVSQATTSWAGVAGNGDVLAGFLTGVLARPVNEGDVVAGPDGQPQRVTPGRLTAAVSVHGRATQVAAKAAGGVAPIQASGIAAAIGQVLSQPTRRHSGRHARDGNERGAGDARREILEV